jgi:hypothetical protein
MHPSIQYMHFHNVKHPLCYKKYTNKLNNITLKSCTTVMCNLIQMTNMCSYKTCTVSSSLLLGQLLYHVHILWCIKMKLFYYKLRYRQNRKI